MQLATALLIALGMLGPMQGSTTAYAQTLPFSSPNVISGTFGGAFSVETADLDGDGDLDVVGAALADYDINWWENDGTPGDGGWTTHTICASFNGAGNVAIGDVDGDGDLDVLGSAYGYNDLTWWQNDGTPADGGWTTHTICANFTGAINVTVGDIDRDGDLDVQGAAFGSNEIAWFENDGTPGDGGWTTHTLCASFSGAVGVEVGDINGDGDLDILGSSNSGNDVTWWQNDGTPGDGGWTTHTVCASFMGGRDVTVGDINGDGDLDILGAAYSDNDVTWWQNDGSPEDGGWTTHTICGSFALARNVSVSDMDGDGDLDVLGAARTDNDIAWWENDGTPGDGGWTTHIISTSFNGAVDVIAGDLDGDGDLDILGAARFDNTIAWWENEQIHSTPVFGSATHTICGTFTGARNVEFADVDGDGDLDVLGTAYTDADITWWENTTGNGTTWITHTICDSFNGANGIAVGDVDGDGDLDVLGTAYSDDDVTWFANDGSPADGGWTTHTICDTFNPARMVAVGDVDGDGDLDVLGAAPIDDDITWWENDGTPGDGGWTTHTICGTFNNAKFVSVGDLDGDGDLDVLGAAVTDDDITWWENDGSPGDGGWTTHTICGSFDGAAVVIPADLDGDGDLDVVGLGGAAGDDLAWWANDGSPADGGWNMHTICGSLNNPTHLTVSDMDSDGDLDVIGASGGDNDITWWDNDGSPADGGWITQTICGSFTAPTGIAVGDIDGDGDIDVLGSSFSLIDITLWPNEGGQFGLPTSDTSPATLQAGNSDDFFKIDFTHNGFVGEHDIEFATMELLLEGNDGSFRAMTTDEANAIIEELRVYSDTGSGSFEEGTDTLVHTEATLSLVSGVQTLTFTDGGAEFLLTQAAGTRSYFLVIKIDAGLATNPNRNGITSIRVTHQIENSSTAEDVTVDAALDSNDNLTNITSAGTGLLGPTAVTVLDLSAAPQTPGSAGILAALSSVGLAAIGLLRRRFWRQKKTE